MFESARPLRDEFAELEAALSDPAVHTDLARARKVGRRYAELTPIVRGMDSYERVADDLAAARELAEVDETFAAEAIDLEAELAVITERLTKLLAPRDPNDSADALMEIKSGEGGEESALFAGDLLKMYSRYAEGRGWKVEVLDAQETDLGGYKSVTVALKAPSVGEPGTMPYGVLKFEGGVHRVQRVPVTESQGRVHTSAAGVLVMPEVEETEVAVDENDLRIDVSNTESSERRGRCSGTTYCEVHWSGLCLLGPAGPSSTGVPTDSAPPAWRAIPQNRRRLWRQPFSPTPGETAAQGSAAGPAISSLAKRLSRRPSGSVISST